MGNIPGSCSSTKLAELSKPEIPNIAAEKPRKRAIKIPPDFTGTAQLRCKVDKPLFAINQNPAMTKSVSETKWIKNITTATIEDSPIPEIVNKVKIPSTTIVAIITSRLGIS